jgi:hypothetical protein
LDSFESNADRVYFDGVAAGDFAGSARRVVIVRVEAYNASWSFKTAASSPVVSARQGERAF